MIEAWFVNSSKGGSCGQCSAFDATRIHTMAAFHLLTSLAALSDVSMTLQQFSDTVASSLDSVYESFENNGRSLAQYIQTADGGPMEPPSNKLQVALYTAYKNTLVHGAYVGWGNGAFIGYYNTLDTRDVLNTVYRSRPAGLGAGEASCSEILEPYCTVTVPSNSSTCAPLSENCRVHFRVNDHGTPTTPYEQRYYSPVGRFWFANALTSGGRSFWSPLSVSITNANLNAYHSSPVLAVDGSLRAVVLTHLTYDAIDVVMAKFAGVSDTVVYLIDENAKLLGSSAGEGLVGLTGQKLATEANTPLIAASAAHLSQHAFAPGEYQTATMHIQAKGYVREAGSLSHTIIVALAIWPSPPSSPPATSYIGFPVAERDMQITILVFVVLMVLLLLLLLCILVAVCRRTSAVPMVATGPQALALRDGAASGASHSNI